MLHPRRRFLKTSAAVLGSGGLVPYIFTADAEARTAPRSANDRFRIGSIGMRYQGTVIAEKARADGDIVAIADVDRHVREQARAAFGSTPLIFEDYRKLLDRQDIDVVTIGAPDHWHTKMVIDACRAGKDVYVEKPLTLTVDEGKLLTRVVKETGRIVQVGSWQRSDHNCRLAVELVRQGRIGKLETVEVILGKNVTGGPFPERPVPGHFNWDMWQGQTPDVPYIEQRSHYTFRWWYEYSGGQMTDWGAHHLDIAQWGIGELPIEIDGKARMPGVKDGYNVAVDFEARYVYPSGVVMTVSDTGRNGIMFSGAQGRIFVNRGTVSGKPVEDLASNPLPREAFQLYDFDNLDRPARVGKLDAIINHMGNFFDCVRQRRRPLSEVVGQHQSVTTCHLGNISMRLGRPLKWDPAAETFPGDAEANAMLSRAQRKGYEVV
ncbi:MAG: Gfo/Idh/MocA family oxidoreductase [Thermoguttaceae bacterium]|jgi:myo-inositol 2-dehydrogenase/D-chiro-inositol 1-dehydrogenase|nr:Gfo/Idh/MocA family oxidoreductase [Thermoguttaceae bacterium]MDI9443147.1 Gfo/Idh/MocA family oxidoreductase [Planctomycetota bacterium]